MSKCIFEGSIEELIDKIEDLIIDIEDEPISFADLAAKEFVNDNFEEKYKKAKEEDNV